jgi:hypothetical protein
MDDAPLDAARSFAISDGAHQIDKKGPRDAEDMGPGGGLRGLGLAWKARSPQKRDFVRGVRGVFAPNAFSGTALTLEVGKSLRRRAVAGP